MITLCSQKELQSAQSAIQKLEKSHPELFEKFLEMINLTRALQLKYQYMGCLIMNEDPGNAAPQFVQGSVIRLYKREMKKLTGDSNIDVLKNIFTKYEHIGYARLSLLALGNKPESISNSMAIIY
jgi:hypothetical protein